MRETRHARSAFAAVAALAAFALCATLACGRVFAQAPAVDDGVVLESVPIKASAAQAGNPPSQRAGERPRDVRQALDVARAELESARSQGDPRHAGRALAVLRPWSDPRTAPPEALLLQATALQHLHDFDGARTLLQGLVQRDARQPQAWLTLATIHRLQGRYAESSQACSQVSRQGQPLYGQACLAETMGLRGKAAEARRMLEALASSNGTSAGQRGWLLTTLAELEARVSRPAAAERAYRLALAAGDDGYARTSYADFLLQQGRPREVLDLLGAQPRSDAVLLRLAIAGMGDGSQGAANARLELAQRMARIGTAAQEQAGHARERAMWALWIQRDPVDALNWARLNLTLQREPVDLLLMARAARAAKQPGALKELANVKKEMGLHDERLDALL